MLDTSSEGTTLSFRRPLRSPLCKCCKRDRYYGKSHKIPRAARTEPTLESLNQRPRGDCSPRGVDRAAWIVVAMNCNWLSTNTYAALEKT